MKQDIRPAQCRFRLIDGGKPYPRSGCLACGKSMLTGLGTSCHRVKVEQDVREYVNFEELKDLARVWFFQDGVRCDEKDDWTTVNIYPVGGGYSPYEMTFTQNDRRQINALIGVLKGAYTLGIKHTQKAIRNELGL